MVLLLQPPPACPPFMAAKKMDGARRGKGLAPAEAARERTRRSKRSR